MSPRIGRKRHFEAEPLKLDPDVREAAPECIDWLREKYQSQADNYRAILFANFHKAVRTAVLDRLAPVAFGATVSGLGVGMALGAWLF